MRLAVTFWLLILAVVISKSQVRSKHYVSLATFNSLPGIKITNSDSKPYIGGNSKYTYKLNQPNFKSYNTVSRPYQTNRNILLDSSSHRYPPNRQTTSTTPVQISSPTGYPYNVYQAIPDQYRYTVHPYQATFDSYQLSSVPSQYFAYPYQQISDSYLETPDIIKNLANSIQQASNSFSEASDPVKSVINVQPLTSDQVTSNPNPNQQAPQNLYQFTDELEPVDMDENNLINGIPFGNLDEALSGEETITGEKLVEETAPRSISLDELDDQSSNEFISAESSNEAESFTKSVGAEPTDSVEYDEKSDSN